MSLETDATNNYSLHLRAMLFQRRSRRVRNEIEAESRARTSGLDASTSSVRLAAEAKRVREMLRPWVEAPLPEGYWAGMRPKEMPRNFFRILMSTWWFGTGNVFDSRLGQIFGPGILMMVAKFDIHSSGKLSTEEEAALAREVNEKADQLMGYATTQMVISMLTLSIAAPFCVYQLSTVTPDELIATPSLGAGWLNPPDWYEAWMGSAALHVLYWIEAVILAQSVMFAAQCILICNFLYMNLAINLPDTESKVYFMVDDIQSIEASFMNAIACIQSLLLALPLLGSRVSPVAGICLIIPTLSLCPLPIPKFSFWFNSGKGNFERDNIENCNLIAPAFHQLRFARDLLAKADGPKPEAPVQNL